MDFLLIALSLLLNQAPQAIRVESAFVAVPVVVTGAEGAYMDTLQRGDFSLYEDGVLRPIDYFARSGEPIKTAMLLDTSKSTVTVLEKIKKAARQFAKQMRPQDLATVITFDSEVRILCNLTSDSRELDRAIAGVRVGEYAGTKMRDAVDAVISRRFRGISGRKAVVLLTDGQDYGSEISGPGLEEAAASSNTVIYPVFYTVDPRDVMKKLFGVRSRLPRPDRRSKGGPYEQWDERERQAADYLGRLSEVSAGRFYNSTIADLQSAFRQITDELHHQYLLGFYPEKEKLDGSLHSLEVRVSQPAASVRSRRQYRAGN